MRYEDRQVKDPVCGTMVDQQQNEIVYLTMHFAFCSQQCKERFLANPHLYIGHPGHKVLKQTGRELIKRRTLGLAAPLSEEKTAAVVAGLRAMMGVKNVAVKEDKVTITYDLLQATAEQIEQQIMKLGASLGKEWADKLRWAFVHYLEETEVQSIEERPRPPGHHH